MTIYTNTDLKQAVNNAIKESGYKKHWIADQLGISRQAFSNYMNKANFSIDDANKILQLIGKMTITEIHENNEK